MGPKFETGSLPSNAYLGEVFLWFPYCFFVLLLHCILILLCSLGFTITSLHCLIFLNASCLSSLVKFLLLNIACCIFLHLFCRDIKSVFISCAITCCITFTWVVTLFVSGGVVGTSVVEDRSNLSVLALSVVYTVVGWIHKLP